MYMREPCAIINATRRGGQRAADYALIIKPLYNSLCVRDFSAGKDTPAFSAQ